MLVNLAKLYKELEINKRLNEANLKQLVKKTSSETPELYGRGQQMLNDVRYFGLSKDGTLNFKVRSQTRKGKYHFSYIEAGDILKFGNVFEDGRNFDESDLTRLLNMNGFRIHCNDESFLYFAFQYIATLNNYEINPETRAPKRNNVLLAGSLCKHLVAVIYNLFNNQKMRAVITKDINNYLRMVEGLDYEDYQQQNYAKQIQQQNRAVKWKNKPSDFMNDYFARAAKSHQFLDDKNIKQSLKKEMNKYLKVNPMSSVDDFLRSYFQMTQKAFADDMRIPENSVEDYFNEIGFEKKKESLLNPPEKEPTNKEIDDILTGKTEIDDDIDIEDDDDDETGGLLSQSVMTNDSEIVRPSVTSTRTTINLKEGTIKRVTKRNIPLRENSSLRGLKEGNNEILDLKEKLYEDYLVFHIAGVTHAFNCLVKLAEENNTSDVLKYIKENKDMLKEVIETHDSTKYNENIWEEYRKHFYPIDDKEGLNTEGYKNATFEHITTEGHHWEYWCCNTPAGTWELKDESEIDDLEYKKYCIERICDWASMSMLFGTRLKDWYDTNEENMVIHDKYIDLHNELVNIINDNEIDVNELINTNYNKLQIYNNSLTPDSLIEGEIDPGPKEGVDRSNLWVHTFGGMGSKMPILGKGFYLYHVNSVSKSKHRDASEGRNKYYRFKNQNNFLVMEDEDSIVPFTDEQLDLLMSNLQLNKMTLTEEFIKTKKGQVVLRELSNLFGDGISELMKEIGIQGILIMEMKNAYHGETVMSEVISYDDSNLTDVTKEVL